MAEELHSKRELIGDNSEADESLYKRPNVNLLDDRQWRYVQRHFRLSPRELQVAKHVCRGCQNDEVARSLKIRSGTVKTHLRNIYRRIHVTNKIGMLLTFVERVAGLSGKSVPSHNVTIVTNQQIESDTGASYTQNKNKQTKTQF